MLIGCVSMPLDACVCAGACALPPCIPPARVLLTAAHQLQPCHPNFPPQAALAHTMDCRSCGASPDLMQLAEAHLHLGLLQRQVALVTPGTATSTVLNAAVLMLEAVAGRAADLAGLAHNVSHFEAACQSARQALAATQAARVAKAAAAVRLPALDGAAPPCGPDSYRLPRGVVPPLSQPLAEGGGMEEVKQREGRNLGSLPLPKAPQPTFAALLAVLRSGDLQQEGDVAPQHTLCMVERALFVRAVKGFAMEARLPQAEVDALVQVVEAYRSGEGGRAGGEGRAELGCHPA